MLKNGSVGEETAEVVHHDAMEAAASDSGSSDEPDHGDQVRRGRLGLRARIRGGFHKELRLVLS